MVLHQLFTLAFALQLEPLSTLDYVAVAHDPSHSSESTPHADSLIVGANTRLEPIVSRHPPHPVQTISFLLQCTKALDAVEPWTELIALLERADDDPSFAKLRQFFDARYDANGKLIGAEPSSPGAKNSLGRLRSLSKATSLGRKSSQGGDARKPSFVQSIGGAAGLKLRWLRKGNESQFAFSQGETSDDEGFSRHSASHTRKRRPAERAPEIHIPRKQGSLAHESELADSTDQDIKTIRFTVRLDLHSIGLAPKPPDVSRGVGRDSMGRARSATSDGSSEHAASHAMQRKPERLFPMMAGGHGLSKVKSPDSTRSIGGASGYSVDAEDADHSNFEALETAPHITTEPKTAKPRSSTFPSRTRERSYDSLSPGGSQREGRGMPSSRTGPRKMTGSTAIYDSAATPFAEYDAMQSNEELGSSPPTSQNSGWQSRKGSMTSNAGNGPRRPSMISKLLDFGLRKKSFNERSGGDSPALSNTEEGTSRIRPSDLRMIESQGEGVPFRRGSMRRNVSGRAQGIRNGMDQSEVSNDEVLDFADDDEEYIPDVTTTNRYGLLPRSSGGASTSRRRSSASSTGRMGQLQNALSVEPDLGPVKEDGTFEIKRLSSRSSAGLESTSLGDDETGSVSAWGDDMSAVDEQIPLEEGKDFVSLFRAASEMSLSVVKDMISANSEEVRTPGASEPATAFPGVAESDTTKMSEKAKGKMPDTGGNTTPPAATPQIRPKRSSISSTPLRSVKSLDLDRSSKEKLSRKSQDGRFNGEEEEPWWPCGEVDPLPVSVSCAFGQALGWEGVMQLCYGRGSRAAIEGDYAPLGRAAAIEASSKQHAKLVLYWRSGVASAEVSPPQNGIAAHPESEVLTAESGGVADLTSLAERLGLEPGMNGQGQGSALTNPEAPSRLDKLLERAPLRHQTVPPTETGTDLLGPPGLDESTSQKANAGQPNGSGPLSPSSGKPTLGDLLGRQDARGRTWQDWMNLAKSIKGWVEEYETSRVRSGLAREIGLDPMPLATDKTSMDHDFTFSALGRESGFSVPESQADQFAAQSGFDQLHVPAFVGSPESVTDRLTRSPDPIIGGFSRPIVKCSGNIPACILKDATNRAFGFRRRTGIPEGLPTGPNGEEFEDYSWSKRKLDVKHFATSLTIGAESLSYYLQQLSSSSWVHRSAWELDYLEMCVFKTPLVAERFPPPGEAIVPSARSYQPTEGNLDRTKLCPNPDENGCWSATEWKQWLSTIKEGDVIVPAVGWQAWWTLISVLNGADRSGRMYDLQVKTPEEPFEALTDLSAVYI